MKEAAKLAFNYKLKKDDIKKSSKKVHPSKHFGTSIYPTCLFYKNITRLFIPTEFSENEK
jgi:hypothetical protein